MKLESLPGYWIQPVGRKVQYAHCSFNYAQGDDNTHRGQ
jgi:hypothetical protein